MRLPDPNTVADRIRSSPIFYPFFKDAVGAIDGSHLFVDAPLEAKARFRDRKGNISQNVLAACDFDMNFVYVLTGWEGSASDSHLYEQAVQSGLDVPAGKYYLADAGFASCDSLLVPYRNVRYHLREWAVPNSQKYVKSDRFICPPLNSCIGPRTRKNCSTFATLNCAMW